MGALGKRPVRRALRAGCALHRGAVHIGHARAARRPPLRRERGVVMLRVDQLCTEYIDARGRVVKAAQDVSFEVPSGKLFTLLGPSGCGKTTTLRSIAGLERPRSGEISVD